MDDPEATQDRHRLGMHLLRTNERSERLIEGCAGQSKSSGQVGRQTPQSQARRPLSVS